MKRAGKIGLAVAAAFGLAYGGYLIGKNSDNVTQNKPLEESVCEDIDTQAIYNGGRADGYLAGRAYGLNEGKNKCKPDEAYTPRLEQEIYIDQGYNQGLEYGIQEGYEDGLIEGEDMGLNEGKSRYMGSGTTFALRENGCFFTSIRNIPGKGKVTYISSITIEEGESRKVESVCITSSNGEKCYMYKPDENGEMRATTIITDSGITNDFSNIRFIRRSSGYTEYTEEFDEADRMLTETRERFGTPTM